MCLILCSNKPAKCHILDAKIICACLRVTINDGIHYWRIEIDGDLPFYLPPNLHKYNRQGELLPSLPRSTHAFADAESGAIILSRRSVGRSVISLAGGPIEKECRFQRAVAFSSAKSELYAACNAAKNVKHYRLMLS